MKFLFELLFLKRKYQVLYSPIFKVKLADLTIILYKSLVLISIESYHWLSRIKGINLVFWAKNLIKSKSFYFALNTIDNFLIFKGENNNFNT